MGTSQSELRSKLGRVKGLGAAHHGAQHWWWQRLTALALVPLSVWFLYSLLTVMLSPDITQTAQWLLPPLNMLVMIFMLIAGFIHIKLGMQVVVEDYIHAPFAKYTLLLFINFACFVLAGVGIAAVFKLHFLDVIAAGV